MRVSRGLSNLFANFEKSENFKFERLRAQLAKVGCFDASSIIPAEPLIIIQSDYQNIYYQKII